MTFTEAQDVQPGQTITSGSCTITPTRVVTFPDTTMLWVDGGTYLILAPTAPVYVHPKPNASKENQ